MSSDSDAFDSVLGRLASLLEVKTDTAIATALGLSRQAFANAKKRGAIPYDKLCQLAREKDISLDYLLLGKGGPSFSSGDIDPMILEGIEKEFQNYSKDHLERLHTGTAYDAGLIYNRVIQQLPSGAKWGDLVEKEIAYLLEIKKHYAVHQLDIQQKREKPLVYEEEQRQLEKIEASVEEVYGMPAANPLTKSDATPQINQKIRGKKHQIAGRDIVNEGKKDKAKAEEKKKPRK